MRRRTSELRERRERGIVSSRDRRIVQFVSEIDIRCFILIRILHRILIGLIGELIFVG
jgi:hypothetical protein